MYSSHLAVAAASGDDMTRQRVPWVTGKPGRLRLARNLAVVAAVVAAGFLAGWSSAGVSSGVVLGIALGAGVSVPVFRGETAGCLPRRRGTR
jgi:hypothetical protein